MKRIEIRPFPWLLGTLAIVTILILSGVQSPIAPAALSVFQTLPPSPRDNSDTTASTVTSADGSCENVLQWWPECRRIARPSTGMTDGVAAEFVTTNESPEGDMPRQLAATPDGTTVVIINRDTDTMTFLDIDTRIITHTVTVEDFPVDVAVTPDGRYAVAPNVFSNSVSVVDIATHTVAAHIPVTGDQPYRVAVTGDSRFAVVGVINDAINSAVSVIDLDTLTEVRSFVTTSQGVFGGFFTPESGIFGNIYSQFFLSPDDAKLVLPDRFNAQVVIYDITTGGQLAVLPTAELPTAVDISSDGTTAVISHEGVNRTITVVDLGAMSVSSTVATPADLSNQVIRLTPDNTHAIVAISNNVIFVDLATGASNTLSTGSVGDIEISFDGQFAFVSNFNARVIDIASQSIVRTITFAACAESVTSPTELRAISLNNRFREDVHVYNINGASGFAEGRTLSGEPEEGDATRTLALTPDGTKVLAANNTSDNVSIIDVNSRTVEAYIPTGERSLGIAVAPDGIHAVVANGEDDTTSIIDLTTNTKVADLITTSRPAEVAISPDSQLAFVTTVAGTDRIYFIQLNGSNSSVLGSIVAGQMGSITYTYGVLSGIAVNPDGSVLAACISFDDQLLLVDPITRTEIIRVPVGDFPIRVTFAPNGDRAYVTHSFSDDVYIVAIDGASSHVEAIIPGIDFPLDVVVDANESFAYVASFSFTGPSIKVIDANVQAIVASIPLDDAPRRIHLSNDSSTLYVMTTGGELVRISASGASSAVIDATILSNNPSDLAFHEATSTAVVAQPVPDGIDIVDFRNVTTANQFNIFRGLLFGGKLSDSFESDDSYLKFRPGITINSSEPPVWIEFDGTLPSDSPTSLSITLEAQASTVGLSQTIEMFNYNSGVYEQVDAQAASHNNDSIVVVDVSANISDYVQSGTAAVKTRTGWRATGPVLNYPWTICIDQVVWTAAQ